MRPATLRPARLGEGLALGVARVHDGAVRGAGLRVQRQQQRAVVLRAELRGHRLQAARALQLHRVAARRVLLERRQRAARGARGLTGAVGGLIIRQAALSA